MGGRGTIIGLPGGASEPAEKAPAADVTFKLSDGREVPRADFEKMLEDGKVTKNGWVPPDTFGYPGAKRASAAQAGYIESLAKQNGIETPREFRKFLMDNLPANGQTYITGSEYSKSIKDVAKAANWKSASAWIDLLKYTKGLDNGI